MVDLTIMRKIALEKGLSLNYISKEDKLSFLLSQLEKYFDNCILKGGTAINRAYLQKSGVNRFSEDIDLDYISKKSISENISDIKSKMKNILEFELESHIRHRTIRYDCRYINELNHKDRIIVEFYLSHKYVLAASKINKILIKSNFIETNPCNFKVYSLEDLIARKLVALYNRMEGKDIYDLFYAIDLEFDKNKLNKAMDQMLNFYKIDVAKEEFLNELLGKLGDAVKKAGDIGNAANHFIPKTLRPDWHIFIKTLKTKIRQKMIWGLFNAQLGDLRAAIQ